MGILSSVEDLPIDDVQCMFDINYFGTVRMIKALLPMLINSHGKIVITSSVAGNVSVPFFAAYSDSKTALTLLSRSLRIELEPFNVQVCCTIYWRCCHPSIWD